jgi:hypothetical protein
VRCKRFEGCRHRPWWHPWGRRSWTRWERGRHPSTHIESVSLLLHGKNYRFRTKGHREFSYFWNSRKCLNQGGTQRESLATIDVLKYNGSTNFRNVEPYITRCRVGEFGFSHQFKLSCAADANNEHMDVTRCSYTV